MKQPLIIGPALKEFHWDDLANLHLEVGYCRHRFIQTVNEKTASAAPPTIADLDQLARVDELLQEAAGRLEEAKKGLFTLCYDSQRAAEASEK